MVLSNSTPPTFRIDATPGRIAVVVEDGGRATAYPCASVKEAEVLLRQEKRRLGLPV